MVFVVVASAALALAFVCGTAFSVFSIIVELTKGRVRPVCRTAFAIARVMERITHESLEHIPFQYETCVNRYKALTSAKSNTQTEKI